MSRFWKRIVEQLTVSPGPTPEAPLGSVRPGPLPPPRSVPDGDPWHDPTDRPFRPNRSRPVGSGLPATFGPASPADGGRRPRLFDPALGHYQSAFRPGDPRFDDVEAGTLWVEHRRRATDHVLRRIAESPLGDHLVLRGSRLLRAWFGDMAREPGDLDYVVDPVLMGLDDPLTAEIHDGLIAAVLAPPGPLGVEFITGAVATDDIWTYERAPGRRVAFPWRDDALPGGVVQIDAVFGEPLDLPVARMPVPVADGGCVTVRGAGPSQSLAWKLLWLATDSYPQGKDLYDAVLLAEQVPLPMSLLVEVLRRGDADPIPETAAGFVEGWAWGLDWKNFRAESPWVAGDSDHWLRRLEHAIEPTFSGPMRPGSLVELVPSDHLTFDPSWHTPAVLGLAAEIASGEAWELLPILGDALQDAGCDRPELLDHCRRGGPHGDRCWVIDRLRDA